jgi:hypothetical protein
MADLPPDLERLGDALTHATTRATALRRHRIELRRRFAGSLLAGLAVFAVMAPSPLGSAVHIEGVEQLAAAPAYAVTYPCDRPRANGGYLPPSCEVSETAQPQAAHE